MGGGECLGGGCPSTFLDRRPFWEVVGSGENALRDPQNAKHTPPTVPAVHWRPPNLPGGLDGSVGTIPGGYPFTTQITDPAARTRALNCEIQNGRGAMLGVFGCMCHSMLDSTDHHFFICGGVGWCLCAGLSTFWVACVPPKFGCVFADFCCLPLCFRTLALPHHPQLSG